jgi:hypothetical protein
MNSTTGPSVHGGILELLDAQLAPCPVGQRKRAALVETNPKHLLAQCPQTTRLLAGTHPGQVETSVDVQVVMEPQVDGVIVDADAHLEDGIRRERIHEHWWNHVKMEKVDDECCGGGR